MQEHIGAILRKDKWLYAFAGILFIGICSWYLYIHSTDLSLNEHARQVWAAAYQIIAIFGCIVGCIVSKKWDGFKSLIGRAMLLFSIGLLLQSFGQSVNSYYIYFEHTAIPYPSLGDVGFMGGVIIYVIAALSLLKATGFQFSVRPAMKKVIAILVPLLILATSYTLFLNGYVFDWSNKVKILLDFGYPLGQAVYLSVVLIAYLSARNYSLGIMKKPLFFLLLALAFQYISDFTFLYQANAGTWHVGGLNDFLYFISYSLMAFSLLVMGGVRRILPDM